MEPPDKSKPDLYADFSIIECLLNLFDPKSNVGFFFIWYLLASFMPCLCCFFGVYFLDLYSLSSSTLSMTLPTSILFRSNFYSMQSFNLDGLNILIGSKLLYLSLIFFDKLELAVDTGSFFFVVVLKPKPICILHRVDVVFLLVSSGLLSLV